MSLFGEAVVLVWSFVLLGATFCVAGIVYRSGSGARVGSVPAGGRMKDCPCDLALRSIVRAYPPVVAHEMAFYPNPQTPAYAVMSVAELKRAFCRECARDLGLLDGSRREQHEEEGNQSDREPSDPDGRDCS